MKKSKWRGGGGRGRQEGRREDTARGRKAVWIQVAFLSRRQALFAVEECVRVAELRQATEEETAKSIKAIEAKTPSTGE